MDRERAEELLVSSWEKPLAPAEAAELAAWLEEDPDLAALDATWAGLGELDDSAEVPSERLRARFYAALAAAQEASRRGGRRAAWWSSPAALRLAAAVGLVVLGLAVGLATAGLLGARAEVRELRAELRANNDSVLLALLEHQAATERLRAVSWSDRWRGDERRLLAALADVVRHDPNVNVRLAAVEALGGRLENGALRRELAASLPEQPSPLLQLRLVELLYGGRDGAHGAEVRELLQPGRLDETARQRLLELTDGRA